MKKMVEIKANLHMKKAVKIQKLKKIKIINRHSVSASKTQSYGTQIPYIHFWQAQPTLKRHSAVFRTGEKYWLSHGGLTLTVNGEKRQFELTGNHYDRVGQYKKF